MYILAAVAVESSLYHHPSFLRALPESLSLSRQATSQSLGLSVPLHLEKEQRENTRQREDSLDPKVVNEEEIQDSMAGALGSVESHSQTAGGNSPVTWFSSALSKTALRICTEAGL